MHHKRRRPKHQRAGCLLCKPWKDERGAKAQGRRPGRRGLRKELTPEEAGSVHHRKGRGDQRPEKDDAARVPGDSPRGRRGSLGDQEIDRQLGFPEVR